MARLLTEEGKAFIRKVCSDATSTSLIAGTSPDRIRDASSNLYNADGHLPFCYPIQPPKIWTSHAKHNGAPITNNQQLGEALIDWFDKYGQQFGLDVNIIAAQAFAESGYKIWNYPLTSTASGINQFIMPTVYDMVINNSNFNQTEKDALTVGWSGSTTDPNTWGHNNLTLLSKRNRPFLHQNICDNPDIMIKAQFVYMKYISDNYSKGIASSTLFGYSRGQGLVKPSYSTSVQKAAAYKPGSGYEMEGVNYVFRIFSLLGNKKYVKYGYFGYDELGMDKPFDSYQAEVAETALRT